VNGKVCLMKICETDKVLIGKGHTDYADFRVQAIRDEIRFAIPMGYSSESSEYNSSTSEDSGGPNTLVWCSPCVRTHQSAVK